MAHFVSKYQKHQKHQKHKHITLIEASLNMHFTSLFSLALTASAFVSAALAAAAASATPDVDASISACNRKCLSNLVDTLLASMVARDPSSLPLVDAYKATENGHPAAVLFMQSRRTITGAGSPSLLALDAHDGTAYFALDSTEGN